MTRYTVHEPPLRAAETMPDPDRFAFVRDGFSVWAFLFAVLWMLWHRLWLVLLAYVVVVAGIESALRYAGFSGPVLAIVAVFISLLVGIESGTLRRFALARRGWKNVGVVSGSDLEEAERRFFAAWTRETPMKRPDAPSAAPGGPVSVAIVDYGSGNLHSAAKAFERAAHEAGLDQPIVVTRDPDTVASADRVVLPGVGAFADCRRGLDAVDGMVAALEEAVRKKGRPFFGICVGMQLLAERGREYEVTEGLGWIAGEVDRIKPTDANLKIPHMGWNTLNVSREHKLLDGLPLGPQGLHAYFVHSFQLKPSRPADLVAAADYGGAVTAVVARDNIVGTQFHPEKSQKLGLALIANFLKWKP